jgi:hypothetical protein
MPGDIMYGTGKKGHSSCEHETITDGEQEETPARSEYK